MQDDSILERSCVLNLDSDYICDDISLTENLLDQSKRILIYGAAGEFVLFLKNPSTSEIRILANFPKTNGFCTVAMIENLDGSLIVKNIVEVFESEEAIKKSHGFIVAEKKIENPQSAVDQLKDHFGDQSKTHSKTQSKNQSKKQKR